MSKPMREKDFKPYDYTKAIKLTKEERDAVVTEVEEIDADLVKCEEPLKNTGIIDKKLRRGLRIRRQNKKQRCLTLNLRILDMKKKQAEANGDSEGEGKQAKTKAD